jgi:endonuclease G, mitochondrial
MNKLLLILMLSLPLFGQDTISIKHTYYTAAFDTVKHYPVIVRWWVCKNMLDCRERIDRKDAFYKDPLIPKYTALSNDYDGSGYDRGHNMPAYDNECDTLGLKECFYYSNMTPQTRRLNRGDWKEVEDYTRDIVLKYDSVKVWCGSVGSKAKIGDVSVPTQCWKVLYIKKLKSFEAFIFENDTSKSATIASHRTTTTQIKKLTNINVIQAMTKKVF